MNHSSWHMPPGTPYLKKNEMSLKRLFRMLFGVPIAIFMTFCASMILAVAGTYKWAWEPEDKNHISNVLVAGMISEIKKFWKKGLE